MPTNTFFDLNEEKRERILNAARRVFTRSEYEKASIQDIVSEAGIPRGSFYQYFENKEDLFLYLHQVNLKKMFSITYQNNMDYFWNYLYAEKAEEIDRLSSYDEITARMEKMMPEDERNFSINSPEPPLNTRRSLASEETSLLFPAFSRFLKEKNYLSSDTSSEKAAFLFSLSDYLMLEYARLKGCSAAESSDFIRDLQRNVYDCLRNQPGTDYRLTDLTKLHFLSSDGADLTVTLSPGNDWNILQEKNDQILQVHILDTSLKGNITLDLQNLKSVKSADSVLSIQISPDQHAICQIPVKDYLLTLTGSYTLTGTLSDGRKVCLIDEGCSFFPSNQL